MSDLKCLCLTSHKDWADQTTFHKVPEYRCNYIREALATFRVLLLRTGLKEEEIKNNQNKHMH